MTTDERQEGVVVGTGDLIGLDALVPIVHPGRRLPPLSSDQLSDILSCRLRDWSDVGGPPGRIDVYVGDGLSGDLDLDARLPGTDLCPGVHRTGTDALVTDAVVADPDGLGLTSSAYAQPATELLLVSGPPDAPRASVDPSHSENRLLMRRLVLHRSIGASNWARSLAQFAASPAGQKIVTASQFVPAPASAPAANRCVTPEPYCTFVKDADPLAGDLEFDTDSSVPDQVVADHVARVCADLRSRGVTDRVVLLAGFADDVGDDEANRALSDDRVAAVAQLFVAQGVTALRRQGFGEARPVDTNQTDPGRRHNRRVEMWLAP